MKITAIETFIVNAIHRNWIFVKVLTDQPGLYGWGEATLEWKTKGVLGVIEDLKPFVIGQNPMNIEYLFSRMTQFSFWPLGSIGLTAVSAIDQAVWDIKSKDLGIPAWQLLGGQVREKIRVYTHLKRGEITAQIDPKNIEAYCDAVEETVSMGYNAIKLGMIPYTGYDAPLEEVRHIEKLAIAIRDRVGDSIDIMTDFHGRPQSVAAAKAYIDAIAPIKPLFIEEPIQPGNTPALAALAQLVDCPLATGERLFTTREFAEVAETRAVTYIQPDLCHCGGLTAGKKIAAIAEAANIGIMPHNPMGPVAGAVALHFDVATPNFVIQEEAVGLVPWFDEIFDHPMEFKDGFWSVPQKIGFGLEINEKAAKKYPYEPEKIPALNAILADGTIANW